MKSVQEREKALPNDILQIFGIAYSNFSRDDICKLTEAKAFSCFDIDGGAMYFLDSIFFKWAEKFNDSGFELGIPDRAKFLASCKDLNPNDEKRIYITRDYKWIKGVYMKVIEEYEGAMRN